MTTMSRRNIENICQANRRPDEEIIAQYSDTALSPLDIIQIRRAERDSAVCKDCAGLPCQKSAERGFKPVVEIDAGYVRVAMSICSYALANKRQEKYRRAFTAAKIPEIYIGKTFDDYELDKANCEAVAYAHEAIDKGNGLYLCGAAGCGKTFLAAIVAQELLKRGKTVIFSDVPTLLGALKATFSDDAEARIDELMANLAAVDVLVLDDLGTETPTEWAVERLYMIVNQRYSANKAIIVTSNLAPTEAEYKLNHPRNAPVGIHGSRIISRIKQTCRLAQIGGGDRRRR